MPLAPTPARSAKMQTKRSAWTPLNHPPTNRKVFEERRRLLAKWFDRWSDGQRKEVLQDFVVSCSAEQLRFLSLTVSRQLPLQAADFTCLLPRALCLYLFSFLDPRSLCRCAQVSWHWKSIVELDQLWMPKCLKLSWCVDFAPTSFEQGVWKRHYIQSVQELRLNLLQHSTVPDVSGVSGGLKEQTESAHGGEEQPASTREPQATSSGSGLKKQREANVLPPWRDSDRHPKDTIRFNYLDNLDPIEQTPNTQMRSRTKTDGRRSAHSEATYKLRKAKSLAPHAHNHLITTETAKRLLGLAQWNAGIRPRPVRTPMPQLSTEALRVFQRSNRSVPSK
ncbi:LOW QUALITY PROTEIN: F-box only protein 16 [Xenentodon cancila]